MDTSRAYHRAGSCASANTITSHRTRPYTRPRQPEDTVRVRNDRGDYASVEGLPQCRAGAGNDKLTPVTAIWHAAANQKPPKTTRHSANKHSLTARAFARNHSRCVPIWGLGKPARAADEHRGMAHCEPATFSISAGSPLQLLWHMWSQKTGSVVSRSLVRAQP